MKDDGTIERDVEVHMIRQPHGGQLLDSEIVSAPYDAGVYERGDYAEIRSYLPNGTPHTAHTTNLVPCIIVGDQVSSVSNGILADVAPSILKLIGVNAPHEMTGSSLI